MPTNKKTKIVATLGPACSTREVLKEMIELMKLSYKTDNGNIKITDLTINEDGTIQVYDKESRIWMYLQKNMLFVQAHNDTDALNIWE